MSKGLRIKELHRARELAAQRIALVQEDSLSSYIQWAKSAPQWGYIIDILKGHPELWSKVGDTHRGWLGPSMRCEEEWYKKFPGSALRYTFPLMLGETHYVRDYYLHRVLLDMKFKKVSREELYEAFQSNDAYSREIFECTPEDVFCAYYYITESFKNGTIDTDEVYTIRQADEKPEEKVEITFRPLQQELIDNVVRARATGRDHLLSYSCPRFGKSACALGAASALDAKSLLVVSAVASVHDEWRKTVENILNFAGDWVFVDAAMLSADPLAANKLLDEGERVLVFLTLQDIQGADVKSRHAGVIGIDFDMMVVDESHIGARGESFAAKLDGEGRKGSEPDEASEDGIAAREDNDALLEYVDGHFSYAFSLHLSGTPYNIMMTDEFSKEDIVSQVSYSDILHAKRQWSREHPDSPEWDNPYFDFPELLTMGIALDGKTSDLFRSMAELGLGELTDIFAIDEEKNLVYPELVYRFFAAIDGTCPDNGIYALMTDAIVSERVQSFQGVFILSRRAQVDAVVDWLDENRERFDNLGKWRFFKATSEGKHMKAQQVKDAVDDAYGSGVNTMTFTVGKMMTGVTVKPWNLMINARPSSDAQFYDQSKARTLSGQSEDIVIACPDGTEMRGKRVLKQQSMFIDLSMNRPMEISAAKAKMRSYSDTGHLTNAGIERALGYEMEVMPHIVPQVMMDNVSTLFVPVEPMDVMKAMSQVDAKRSLVDQAMFARTVNENWFEDPYTGSWMDKAIALSKPSETKVLMDAFSSRDGIYSEIDIDDVEGLAGLADDAEEWARRNKEKAKSRKKELSAKKEQELTEEEARELAATEKTISEIREIAKAAKVLQEEKLAKQRRLIVSIATYMVCSPYEIKCYKDVIKSLGHKYNSKYKECIRIAHNLGLDTKTLIAVYDAAREVDRFELDQIALRMHDVLHSEELSEMEKIQALFNSFPSIGSNEIVTPLKTCKEMVSDIDEKTIEKCVRGGSLIVGFSEEIGEFSAAMRLRMMELGYSMDDIKTVVASMPQSPVAYEMTRKIYEMLNLDERNIVHNWGIFDLYDKIVGSKKDGGYGYDYKAIADTLGRSKSGYLCDTTLDKDEAKECKKMIEFGAIVGNPPYQGENHQQIYVDFVLCSKVLADDVCLIFPVGWQEPKTANNLGKMNKKEVKEDLSIVFIDNRQNVFHNVSGAEWTNIVYWKKGYNNGLGGKQKILTNGADPVISKLYINKADKPKPKEIEELSQVVKDYYGQKFIGIDTITSSRKPYGIRTDVIGNEMKYGLPVMSEVRQSASDIRIYGLYNRSQSIRYVPSDYPFPKDTGNINKYRVLIGKAWGNFSKNYLGGAYADIIIAFPGDACTENFIESGAFDTLDEAQFHAKYLLTQFARALVLMHKTSQDNSKDKWVDVPLQDFKEDWWTESIISINEHLFDKYNVPEHIREYVNQNIQLRSEDNIIVREQEREEQNIKKK